MKQFQTVLIALVVLLGLAGAAEASADLFTPPLFAGVGEVAVCRLTNVSALPRTVQIQMYDALGTLVQNLGPVTLHALNTQVTGKVAVGFFVCRFTVPSKTTIRAAGIVSVSGSDTLAVPAQ